MSLAAISVYSAASMSTDNI